MAPVTRSVEPFGDVQTRPLPDGSLQIVATVLMEPDIEGAACGLVLDASVSMRRFYGAIPTVSPLFRPAALVPNVVEPVARSVAGYLAGFSGEGYCPVLYGSCGSEGHDIEELGEVRESDAPHLCVLGPQRHCWGRHTRLLPPLRSLVNGVFPSAPWSLAVIVTDGSIDDLADLQRASRHWAREIADGSRPPFQVVIIGLGDPVYRESLVALRDLWVDSPLRTPQGQPLELWDFKLAADMRCLEELFARAVSPQTVVADWARIIGPDGRIAAEYRDGMPARLCFQLPSGSRSFTLELPSGRAVQNLPSPASV
jgi:hypothetical protein